MPLKNAKLNMGSIHFVNLGTFLATLLLLGLYVVVCYTADAHKAVPSSFIRGAYDQIVKDSLWSLPTLTSEYHERWLQSVECEFKFCGHRYNPQRRRSHLLANIDWQERVKLSWMQHGDFCVTLNNCTKSLVLDGALIPSDVKKYGFQVLNVSVTYSANVDATECYCASDLAPWNGQFQNPKYAKLPNDCTKKAFDNRPLAAQQLKFCPKCARENKPCLLAKQNQPETGAPDPVYRDWYFFMNVGGTLFGQGLPLFAQTAQKSFPKINADIDVCTIDISGLPLPQFFCSDLKNPGAGFGFGVNGKNQKCGFSSGFRCAEFYPDQDDISNKKPIADFSFKVESCPQPLFPLGICEKVTEKDCMSIGGDFSDTDIVVL